MSVNRTIGPLVLTLQARGWGSGGVGVWRREMGSGYEERMEGIVQFQKGVKVGRGNRCEPRI